MCHGTRHRRLRLPISLWRPIAVVNAAARTHGHVHGLVEGKTGAALGPLVSQLQWSGMTAPCWVTGAPIGYGDPSQALSNAHVVMQCNAVAY